MKERTSRHLKEPGLSELGVHASLPDLIFGHIYAQSSIPSPTPEGAPPRTDAHPLPPIVPAPAPGKDFITLIVEPNFTGEKFFHTEREELILKPY